MPTGLTTGADDDHCNEERLAGGRRTNQGRGRVLATTARDQKTPVRVNKQDDNKRAFTHMGDALRWAGDPELAKQFDAEGEEHANS